MIYSFRKTTKSNTFVIRGDLPVYAYKISYRLVHMSFLNHFVLKIKKQKKNPKYFMSDTLKLICQIRFVIRDKQQCTHFFLTKRIYSSYEQWSKWLYWCLIISKLPAFGHLSTSRFEQDEKTMVFYNS